MKKLQIIYHSQSGSCAKLARAALQGARREPAVRAGVLRAWDAGLADIVHAEGLLLVAAENSAAVNGGMKDFLDRVFYPAIQAQLVMPYGLIISAGNDGRGAQAQVQRILSGIPLVPALEPLIVRGEVEPEHLHLCEQQGEAFATGLSMGIF